MLYIRFDGPPSHESGRFIEVERDGESISYGEWKQDGDDWLLVIPDCQAERDALVRYIKARIAYENTEMTDEFMSTMLAEQLRSAILALPEATRKEITNAYMGNTRHRV